MKGDVERRSSLPGSRLTTAISLLAVLIGPLAFTAAVGQGPELPPITVTTMATAKAVPATYATWAFRIENAGPGTVQARVILTPAPGWSAVNAERLIQLAPGRPITVPFTVWVPAQASADITYRAGVRVLDDQGNLLASASQAAGVHATENLSLTVEEPALFAQAGRRVRHLFHLCNTGNRAATIRLETRSEPHWPCKLSVSNLALAAGGSSDIEVETSIPRSAVIGAINLLTVTATVKRSGTAGETKLPPLQVSRQATVEVERRRAPGRYQTLPMNTTLSVLGRDNQEAMFGIRAKTRGSIGKETSVELDMDLESEHDNQGENSWATQHIHLELENRRLRLAMGDITSRYPEAAIRSLSSRGLALEAQGSGWTSRFFTGRDRSTSTRRDWAAGYGQELGPGLLLGADLIRRHTLATTTRAATFRDLAVISLHRSPSPNSILNLETVVGRLDEGAGSNLGLAGQITLKRKGKNYSSRAVAYAGNESNPGWRGNREGLQLYTQYSYTRPVMVWGNIDASRGRSSDSAEAPELAALSYRLGGRVSPRRLPRLECSVDGRVNAEGPGGTLRNTAKRALGLATWYPVGPMLLGASGRWGHAYDHNTAMHGSIRAQGMSVSGASSGVAAALRWDREQEWLPEAGDILRSSSMAADLSWSQRSGGVQLGISLTGENSYSDNATAAERTQYTVRPRFDWRLFWDLSLHTEAGWRRLDDATTIDHWQINLAWMGNDVLPVFWSPLGGELCTLIFLDHNLDGQHNFGEPGIGGVIVMVDGEPHTSEAGGTVCTGALSHGDHILDLNVASLPPGLVARQPFPRTIWVEAEDRVLVSVPLTRNATLSGSIFLDDDYDNTRGEDETGMENLRLVLYVEEMKTSECLSDAQGEFRFAGIAPGWCVVRIADGWLPSGWTFTAPHEMSCELVPGMEAKLPPCGVAPKQRPIVMTFGSQRTPEISVGGGTIEPTADPSVPGEPAAVVYEAATAAEPSLATRHELTGATSPLPDASTIPPPAAAAPRELAVATAPGRTVATDAGSIPAGAPAIVQLTGTTSSTYVLQVASFRDSTRARRFRALIESSLARAVSVVPTEVDGETWNRVYLGYFGTRRAAEEVAGSLVHACLMEVVPATSAATAVDATGRELTPSPPGGAPPVTAGADPHHTLQVASFRDPARAHRFEAYIETALDDEIRVTPARVFGERWHRVYVGRFPTRDAAQRMAHTIAGARFTEVINVVESDSSPTDQAALESVPQTAPPAQPASPTAQPASPTAQPASPPAIAPSTTPQATTVAESDAVAPIDNSHHALQLGSFQDPERARRLQAALESAFAHTVDVVPTPALGRLWHRVYLGRFPTRLAAEELAATIKNSRLLANVDLPPAAVPEVAATGTPAAEHSPGGPIAAWHTLQVASFRDPARARRLKLALESSCAHTVTIVPTRVAGNLWHRVYLGRFPAPDGARELSTAVASARLVEITTTLLAD